ncbi:efflux RND transporter periplasmic adaptor subunit [Sulfurovum sp.]|uniref:efflux RND transporter periplasmic adaptor subunit n=1 Tax=Sulfurovum sp. TaxID=1969726 RepID=UPI00286806EF|nr:efflux RND transporter periplasmic adaptor subunit [Sulfurovum sp.]
MKYLLPALLIASFWLEAAEAPKAPPPSLVTTAPVTQGIVNPLQTYVGTLYYDKKSKLASEFEGLVSTLAFREGQHVLKDTVLIELDSQVLQANIAAKRSSLKALEADLARQERDFKRTKALHDRNSVSQSNYDQVFYGMEKLRASTNAVSNELKAMMTQLEKTRIKAPFDAVIATRNVEVGEWVGKGNVIATLVAIDTIEARLNIPARLIDTLKSYKSFQAYIEKREIEVTLKSVIPVADTATRTFPVKLNVPKNAGLIEGMRIDVKVPILKEQTSFMVPRDAVIKRFGQTVVFAAIDGMAVMIPVNVIGYKMNLAAISGEGLAQQMRIVIKGNERIFPNMPVMEKK